MAVAKAILGARTLAAMLLVAIMTTVSLAQLEGVDGAKKEEGDDKGEPGIRDNSFLIEEAFNQEQGVVQHIFNWVPTWERNTGRENDFDFVFTQEWPVFSQKHQFSYTLPMLYMAQQGDGGQGTQAQGFGDIMLNYRYQLFDGNLDGWWVAPRFSVILPTGNEEMGLGNGQVGYQTNIACSKEFKKFGINFNAGATHTPGVTAGIDPSISPLIGQDLSGCNLGGSAIYFMKPYFNLMIETVALWDDQLNTNGTKDRTFQYIVSPGFRWAPYTHEDTQWVIGAALPVGLTPDAPDLSAFFYMSFEHRIAPKRGE